MKKPGVVLEIQRQAMVERGPITPLLRLAWMAANKLDLGEMAAWLGYELKGYPEGIELPEYRRVGSELKGMNPVLGPVPVQIPDVESELLTRSIKLRNSAPELEAAIFDKDGVLLLPQPRIRLEFPAVLVVQYHSVRALLEHVRTAILEWAVALEKKGVLGDDILTFTEAEREKAKEVPTAIHIGTLQNAVFQHSSPGAVASVRTGVELREVEPLLHQVSRIAATISDTQRRAELETEVENLRAELKKPEPKKSKILIALNVIGGAGRWAVENADKLPLIAEQIRGLLPPGII